MKEVHFTKMSGAGNDFVVIDNREGIITHPNEAAQRFCHRRLGIGADGLLLVEKSSTANFTMKYFNADGSYGGMCGNGGRCIAKFAHTNGIVKTKQFTFETLNYIYQATVLKNTVSLKMKNPTDIRLNQSIQIDKHKILFHFINTGSPHCVIFADENKDLFLQYENMDINILGRKIRNHKYFSPEGANINFIKRDGNIFIQIRTYERGVEEETLACGTGSTASALIANALYFTKPPINLAVRSGEHLTVDFHKNNDQFSDVILTGGADSVYSGVVKIDKNNKIIFE